MRSINVKSYKTRFSNLREKFAKVLSVTTAIMVVFALCIPAQALAAGESGSAEPTDKTINKVDGVRIDGVEVNLFNYDDSANAKGLGPYGYYFFHGQGENTSVDGDAQKEAGSFNEPDKFMAPLLDSNGFPSVNVPAENTGTGSSVNVSMEYLFSKSSGYLKGSSYDGAGLFQVIDNGSYQYDSAKNAAYANINDGKLDFTLYDSVVRPSYIESDLTDVRIGNFLPFNQLIAGASESGGTAQVDMATTAGSKAAKLNGVAADVANGVANSLVDLWFGMTVDFEFYMPKDGKVTNKKTSELTDMVFDFYGDDDVFVYIDGVLVLNIGGTHAAESGKINFATGEVIDPTCKDSKGNVKPKTLREIYQAAKGDDFDPSHFDGDTFADYSEHSLKFFYMERGGNISYCRLTYNMPVLSNDLNVLKHVDEAGLTESTTNDVYAFNLYEIVEEDGEEVRKPAQDCEYFVTHADGSKDDQAHATDSDGTFTLKANEAASFTFENEMIASGKTYEVVEQPSTSARAVKRETITIDADENHHDSTFSESDHYTSGKFQVTPTQRVEVVFENAYFGELGIGKTVSGDDATSADLAKKWDFDVTLSSNVLDRLASQPQGASAKQISLEYDIHDADGIVSEDNEAVFAWVGSSADGEIAQYKGSVAIAHGQIAVFEDIPAGTAYLVEEKDAACSEADAKEKGYITTAGQEKVVDGSSVIVNGPKGVIENEGSHLAAFVNDFGSSEAPPNPEPSDPKLPDTGDDPTDEKAQLAATGDNAPVLAFALLAVLGLACVAFAARKITRSASR